MPDQTPNIFPENTNKTENTQSVLSTNENNTQNTSNQNIGIQMNETLMNLSSTEKILGMLAYMNILVFLPIINQPQSEYNQFHTKQGFVLTIIDFVLFVGLILPKYVLPAIIMNILIFFLFLGLIALHGFLIFKAFNGEKFSLPIIGEVAQKINISKLDPIRLLSSNNTVVQTVHAPSSPKQEAQAPKIDDQAEIK